MTTATYLALLDKNLAKTTKHYKQNNQRLKTENVAVASQILAFFPNVSEDFAAFFNWAAVRSTYGLPVPRELKEFAETDETLFQFLHPEISEIICRKLPEAIKNSLIVFGEVYPSRIAGFQQCVFYSTQTDEVYYREINLQTQHTQNVICIAPSFTTWLEGYLAYLVELTAAVPAKPNVALDKKLSDHTALYRYVEKLNWDDGQEKLEYIAQSTKCDEATALLIYFRSIPWVYDEPIGRQLQMLPFVIEDHLKNGFYSVSDGIYDPEKDGLMKEYRVALEQNAAQHTIPYFILEKVKNK